MTTPPLLEPPRRGALSRWLNALGEGLRRHRRAIQRGQWAIVFIYLVVVAVPAFLPLPGRLAHIWDKSVPVALCLWFAARSLKPLPVARFHRLAQCLIPIAGCRVFLRLGGITVTMLRAEDLALGFVGPLRALLLGGAVVRSIVLAWKIAGLNTERMVRRCAATLCVALAASAGLASWAVYFWVWQ